MKKLALLSLLIVLATSAFGQNRARFHHIIDSTTFRSGGNLPIVHKLNAVIQPSIDICAPSLRGIVTLDSKTGTLSIDFFTFTTSGGSTGCISSTTPLGTFEVNLSRGTLGTTTREVRVPFRALSFSIGTVPFKYRFKTGDAPATVSNVLGVTGSVGWTWGTSIFTHRTSVHRSFTLGPLVGLSSADLKKETSKSPATWDANNNRVNLAMMYGVSAVLARNNLGLVFSLGFDNAFGPLSKEWAYQNKLWFGIGVNTNIGLF